MRTYTHMLAVVIVALELTCPYVSGSSLHQRSPLSIAQELQVLRDRGINPRDVLPIEHPLVTEADWDRYTVKTDTPPKIYVDNLDVTMIGKEMKTINDRTIYAFQGIRYGKQPTRFKYSEMAGKYWGDETEVHADHIGDKCVQHSMIGSFASGSEDCLFLNVYTPYVKAPAEPLPVMVFIHGGSFTSGDTSLYMPTRLLDQDVILVVIQYRLGALGWLSMQNDNSPGNAGLSDQILSLQWVQANIASFNGDPDRVTIFGQSAGAASVSMLQTIGEPTEGLFAGMIAESGSSLEYWAIDNFPVNSAKLLGNDYCGCSAGDNLDLLYQCLMDKTAKEISMCTSHMVSARRQAGYMGFEGCAPVVQDDSLTVPRYITQMPSDYISQGLAHDVPIMMGANRDEGSFVFGVMYSAYLVPNNLTDDGEYLANQVIPDVLNAFGVQDQTHAISDALAKEYLPGVDMTSFEDVVPGMIDLVGVLFLKGGTYQTALQHSYYYTQNTYFYSFDFVSDDSLFYWMFLGGKMPFDGGVTHGDELMYLFSLPADLDEKQLLTKDRLVKLWTNFAKYGNPTPEDDPDLTTLAIPILPTLDSESKKFLLIQDDVTVETDYTSRWHIEMDLSAGTDTTTTTMDPEKCVDQDEYDKVKQERDDFLITMIVFIVAFVVADGAAAYLWFKNR